MMALINEILNVKGHKVFSIGCHETVYAALKLMADRNVGSLLVTDGVSLLGVFTERQYARHAILKGRTSSETLVRDVMEKSIAYAEPDETVEDCLTRMIEERVRYMPIVERERVVGIISIGDLVRSVIDDQRVKIGPLDAKADRPWQSEHSTRQGHQPQVFDREGGMIFSIGCE
jgi:CBS domain-containing protein